MKLSDLSQWNDFYFPTFNWVVLSGYSTISHPSLECQITSETLFTNNIDCLVIFLILQYRGEKKYLFISYIYHKCKEGNLQLIFHSSQSLGPVTQYTLTATVTPPQINIYHISNFYISIKNILQGRILLLTGSIIYVNHKIQIILSHCYFKTISHCFVILYLKSCSFTKNPKTSYRQYRQVEWL